MTNAAPPPMGNSRDGLPPIAPRDAGVSAVETEPEDKKEEVVAAGKKEAEKKKEEEPKQEETEKKPGFFRRIGSWFSGEGSVPSADLEDDSEWYYDDDKKCWQKKGAETTGPATGAAPPPMGKAGGLIIDTSPSKPDGGGPPTNGPPTPGLGLSTPGGSRLRSRYVDVLGGTPASGGSATSAKEEEVPGLMPVRATPPANVMMFMPAPKSE